MREEYSNQSAWAGESAEQSTRMRTLRKNSTNSESVEERNINRESAGKQERDSEEDIFTTRVCEYERERERVRTVKLIVATSQKAH